MLFRVGGVGDEDEANGLNNLGILQELMIDDDALRGVMLIEGQSRHPECVWPLPSR